MDVARADLRGALPAVALLLAGVLSGCSGPASGPADAVEPSAAPAYSSYVALGDSFTAAPFVPGTQLAEGCFRSSGNYPSILADDLGARLRDVSCGGARTDGLTGRQRIAVGETRSVQAPQLAAVRLRTDLVTVSIGGNDEGLFQALLTSCAQPPLGSCVDRLEAELGSPQAVLERTGGRVTAVLRAVTRRAPDATVLLVGYPRLVDPDRSCRAMPMTDSDRTLMAALEQRLARTLARAAADAGVEYVDMYSLSAGHEVCSDDPWVNGKVTDTDRALAFHPFAAGQQAVAEAVLERLDALGSPSG